MKQTITALVGLLLAAVMLSSCDDKRSFADMLSDENKSVNLYLSDHRVVGSIPPDSAFEVGPDAPYYQLDEDGNIYMQVLSKGDMKLRPVKDDRVYFRFLRYNLNRYQTGEDLVGVGNSNDIVGSNGLGTTYFLYDNYKLQTSYKYGTGLQMPMHFLGANAHVMLIVKSQSGWPDEMANVIPFLYDVTYYSSPLSPWKAEVDADNK